MGDDVSFGPGGQKPVIASAFTLRHDQRQPPDHSARRSNYRSRPPAPARRCAAPIPSRHPRLPTIRQISTSEKFVGVEGFRLQGPVARTRLPCPGCGGEASATTSSAGKARSARISSMTCPTLPVAPTDGDLVTHCPNSPERPLSRLRIPEAPALPPLRGALPPGGESSPSARMRLSPSSSRRPSSASSFSVSPEGPGRRDRAGKHASTGRTPSGQLRNRHRTCFHMA